MGDIMLLDLREIAGVPGGRVPFDYEPDLSGVSSPGSVAAVCGPSRAAGSVVNSAGALSFSADLDTVLICVCGRCLVEYKYPVRKRISAYLTEEESENPMSYTLQGDKADIGEIILTEFILDLPHRLLCREDCAGLCEKCGSDLNASPCPCKTDIDPRLAVLGQLLDNE
jgi:uncharacterized protein